ncbi:MAG: hypothetical protein JO095_17835 [Alphaproteobacteria bacterium]|nr:hypothetical protein [Alphaproteobacteria bacterium]
MTEDDGNVQIGRNFTNTALETLTLVIGFCLFSMGAGAADGSGRRHASELRTLVATGDALPEDVMEKQTGTGLHPPTLINNDQAAGPRIQLWDELRIGPQVAPGTNGIIAGGPSK